MCGRRGAGSILESWATLPKFPALPTLKPTPKNRRLSKKVTRAAEETPRSPPRCRGRVVGRRRDAFRSQTSDQEGMGSARSKTGSEGQKALRMALPLRLCVSKEWRGPLADPAEGRCRDLLDGALPLCARGG